MRRKLEKVKEKRGGRKKKRMGGVCTLSWVGKEWW